MNTDLRAALKPFAEDYVLAIYPSARMIEREAVRFAVLEDGSEIPVSGLRAGMWRDGLGYDRDLIDLVKQARRLNDAAALTSAERWLAERTKRSSVADQPEDDLPIIKVRLLERVEDVALHLFPNGKRVGREWCIGDMSGAPGNSLKIVTAGEKAGWWQDYATSDKPSRSVLDLWMQARGVDFPTAVREAREFVGLPRALDSNGCSTPRNAPQQQSCPVKAFDWPACVEAFSDDRVKQLVQWRGFSTEFVMWLKTNGLIGIYKGCIAFPVADERGRVLGTHYRSWPTSNGKGDWFYSKDNGGARPLLIGRLSDARQVFVAESTWDGLAVCEQLGIHETDAAALLVTRGAGNVRLIDGIPKEAQVIALPQNDEPGQKWLEGVRERIGDKLKVLRTPQEHKDPDDWVRSGAGAAQLMAAIAAGDDAPLFADVATLIAGGLQPERPTLACVSDDFALLYRGRLNEIHSTPGDGKTNIALCLSIRVMQAGGHVVYLDPEDTPAGILRRLLSLGCLPDLAVTHFHYVHNPEPQDYLRTLEWSKAMNPALVALDGLAEALAAENLDENNPSDVLSFFRTRLRPFSELGAGVLIADHVVKDSDSRGHWSRGSGAKMGRYDGVSYNVEVVEPYSPTVAGSIRLNVAKDRNGGVGVKGQRIAQIRFTPTPSGTAVTIDRCDRRQEQRCEEFVPTAIMEKVSRHLELYPEAGKRDLRSLGGKGEYVDLAIEKLRELGHLTVTPQGPGKPTIFSLLKPYRQ